MLPPLKKKNAMENILENVTHNDRNPYIKMLEQNKKK